MRQIFVILALVCLLLVLIEVDAKKGKWRKNKHMSKKGKGGPPHHGNNISKQKMKRMMKKMKKMEKIKALKGEGDWSTYNPRLMKKVGPKQHISWLKLKSDKDCGMKCERGEVCIVGPIDARLMCVSKRDLKKSMKLFHKYQKKEKKAWKAFRGKHYNRAEADDDVYYSKFDPEMEKEDMDKTDTGMVQPQHGGECTTAQFSLMRKRMMGWFHLLHGQDHLAQVKQKANIKHFHKHNSFMKEQQEANGTKCECAKSAMWQFHKMDKTTDDYLSRDEIEPLYENDAEPCMEPFFTSCDLNADQKLSSLEWCCCFSNIVAPCFNRLEQIRSDAIAVDYMPRCDREGYYKMEQCSGKKHGTYRCWCVDYNGNEFKDSARDGRAHCGKLEPHGYEKKPEMN